MKATVMRVLLLPVFLMLLVSCSTTQVKTTRVVVLDTAQIDVPEHELLDVGINLFDPNLTGAADDDSIYPEVRQGESRYFPVELMETMQRSAHWGAVRVVPAEKAAVDVLVNGKILESNGERLALAISVTDATGRLWFDRDYKATVSRYAYKRQRNNDDPFQGLYNKIANDIATYHAGLTVADKLNVHTVAELKFAQDFSPQSFGGHLLKNKKGIFEVQRLPAELDPMLKRVRKIRERDYLFVDTLQDYYGNFQRQMSEPYLEWRQRSYDEVIAVETLKRSSRNRTIGGIAAIIGGIIAAGNGNGSTRAAANVAIYGGIEMMRSGFSKGAEASLHSEALQELSESLSVEITPQVIELDDKTITLTGTVNGQYEKWRELLREIYAREEGDLPELISEQTQDDLKNPLENKIENKIESKVESKSEKRVKKKAEIKIERKES